MPPESHLSSPSTIKAMGEGEVETSRSSASSSHSSMKPPILLPLKKRKHDHKNVTASEHLSKEAKRKPKKTKTSTSKVVPEFSLSPTENHEIDLNQGVAETGTGKSLTSPRPSASEEQSPSPSTSRKRKHDDKVTAELEVDISAPEPPSKKALRKAKKAKTTESKSNVNPSEESATKSKTDHEDKSVDVEQTTDPKRSGHGIWIGNLPWITTKPNLLNWFTDKLNIEEAMITRIHMPVPTQKPIEALRQKIQPQNKGYAYVDFSTEEIVGDAIALSETLFAGRRVLIKDAKSFEGRPEPLKEDDKATILPQHPQSKRVFVGNLPFDTTTQELQDQFAKCGEILEVFMATFEDTGKCKGYAWIQFAELEPAVAAVRGWASIEARESDSEDGESEEDNLKPIEGNRMKKPKTRKWWVNKIRGRALRMEFAEDKAIRYKKRFGKDGSATKKEGHDTAQVITATSLTEGDNNAVPVLSEKNSSMLSKHSESRHNGEASKSEPGSRKGRSEYVKKKETPLGRSGAGTPAVARLTGAILPGAGKKITFE